MTEPVETTLIDRTKTGAVNAGVGGVTMMGMFWGMNGIDQLLSKSGGALSKTALKPLQWKLTGWGAAIAGVFGFIAANKARELKAEKAITEAAERYHSATNPLDKKRYEAELDQTVSDVMDGKDPQTSSTKFRDMVASSRGGERYR